MARFWIRGCPDCIGVLPNLRFLPFFPHAILGIYRDAPGKRSSGISRRFSGGPRFFEKFYWIFTIFLVFLHFLSLLRPAILDIHPDAPGKGSPGISRRFSRGPRFFEIFHRILPIFAILLHFWHLTFYDAQPTFPSHRVSLASVASVF